MLARMLLAAMLVPLLACEADPVRPDSCPAPCARRVGYLRLDTVHVVGAIGTAYDGLPLLPATGASVRYSVTNVGDTVSAPAPVIVNYLPNPSPVDTVPPLAPGTTITREVALDYRGVPPFRFAGGDRDRVSVFMDAPADSTGGYSFLSTPDFRAAIPLLALQPVADSMRVRAGHALTGEFRVVNRSRHSASAPVRVVGCLYDRFWGCWPEYWTSFGGWDLPAIEPQGTHTFATSLTVPTTAAWQDEDLVYALTLCSVSTAHDDPYLPVDGANCASGSVELLVRPDYTACAPPLLQPGVPSVLSTYNCGLRPPTAQSYPGLSPTATENRRFHLLALDAAGGTTYRLERSAGVQPLRFYDADGLTQDDLDPAADRVRFAEGGRLYLVLYTPQPALTVTLELL